MKRALVITLLAAIAAFALGAFTAAITNTSPSGWLVPQDPTGRPPRLIALLALGPIIVVGVVVVAIRLYRAARTEGKPRKK